MPSAHNPPGKEGFCNEFRKLYADQSQKSRFDNRGGFISSPRLPSKKRHGIKFEGAPWEILHRGTMIRSANNLQCWIWIVYIYRQCIRIWMIRLVFYFFWADSFSFSSHAQRPKLRTRCEGSPKRTSTFAADKRRPTGSFRLEIETHSPLSDPFNLCPCQKNLPLCFAALQKCHQDLCRNGQS